MCPIVDKITLLLECDRFAGETRKSVFGDEAKWEDGKICHKVNINEATEVRLIRKGVARYNFPQWTCVHILFTNKLFLNSRGFSKLATVKDSKTGFSSFN